eukprot:1648241-Rhodomonas_salina.2
MIFTKDVTTAFLVGALLVGLQDVEKVPAWTMVYSTISCVYVNVTFYVVAVLSAGQSVLWSNHLKALVFQCIYGHLGAVAVMHCHLKNERSSVILCNVLIMHSHCAITEQLCSVKFRGVSTRAIHFGVRVGTFLMLTSVQRLAGIEWETYLAAPAYEAVIQNCYPAAVFLLPPLLQTVADWGAQTCQTIAAKAVL